MNDLLAALQKAGWRLLSEDEYPQGSAEPFVLEDDQARWGLVSPTGSLLELEFHAFADLGQRTDRLRDILYCADIGTGCKLYFDKRESPEWKANLSRFVSGLAEVDGDGEHET